MKYELVSGIMKLTDIRSMLIVIYRRYWMKILGKKIAHIIFFDFSYGMWKDEPGIEPLLQQWPQLFQWQYWILNPLSHKGTPVFFFFFLEEQENVSLADNIRWFILMKKTIRMCINYGITPAPLEGH